MLLAFDWIIAIHKKNKGRSLNMKNLKKLIVNTLVVASVALLPSVAFVTAYEGHQEKKKVQIVQDGDLMVVKDNDKEKSTVATQVNVVDKEGNVEVTNLFDKDDTFTLDKSEVKEKLHKGDNVYVTFKGDWVESEKKFNTDDVAFSVEKNHTTFVTVQSVSDKDAFAVDLTDPQSSEYALDPTGLKVGDILELKENKYGEVLEQHVVAPQ